MPVSIIRVYNTSKGRWESGARVVLEWTGIANLGMSKPAYTSSDGTAVIDHSSTGMANIYVNGNRCDRMPTPGSHTVKI